MTTFHYLLVLGVVLVQLGAALGLSWSEVSANGASFPSRKEALAAFDDTTNSFVIFGGKDNDDNAANSVWRMNVTSGAWEELTVASGSSPAARFSLNGGFDPASSGNKLIIFGGEDADKNILNDVWEFDLTTRQWTELSSGGDGSGIPEPRYGSSGGVISQGGVSYLLVTHGFDKKNRWDNSWAFDIAGQTWTEITPKNGPIPTPRCLVAGATMQVSSSLTRLGMFGGCGSGGYGPCPSSQMWVLTVSNLGSQALTRWEMAPTCLRARNYGAMASAPTFGSGGTFFVFGGAGGPLVSNDVDGQLNSLAVDDMTWKQSVFSDGPAQPGGNKQSAMATSSGNRLYLQLGGSSQVYTIDFGSLTNTAGVPNDQECHSDPIPGWRTTHGVVMGIAWGFLIPMGVFIARFGRIKDPLWFKIHRACNVLGVILGLFGFIVALLMVSAGKFLAVPHSFFGIIVTLIGIQQPLNAYFRPHVEKGSEKPKKRVIWEYWHKYSGRLGLVLGLINPFWGISYLVGTGHAGFIVYAIWVAIYVLAFAFLTAKGLPYEANGPSKLAQFVNEKLCCCLGAWDDSLKSRTMETPPSPKADAEAGMVSN